MKTTEQIQTWRIFNSHGFVRCYCGQCHGQISGISDQVNTEQFREWMAGLDQIRREHAAICTAQPAAA